MNALSLLRTALAAAEPPATRDKRYLVHVYAIADHLDLQRALPISVSGVKQPDVRALDLDPDVPHHATVNFDIYVDAASPLELAQKIALFLLRTQAALREPALFGAGYAGCGARTKQEITDLAKRLARRAVARGVAQAAVETPVIKRSVLVCVFRGSKHKEHADAFSSDLAAAGVATRPDHGNPADRYSEVHVNVRGPKSEITTTLRTTLRLLRKHHGLFVRYRRSSTGLQDFECAPSDFEPADYRYMLEHGDQNVTGAAEPPASPSRNFDFYFWVTPKSVATDMALAVSDIVRASGATAHVTAATKFRHFPTVNDAVRACVRVTTARFNDTVRALLGRLPKYRGFVAFCNNEDADDSFILPSDHQGIAELVRTLAREWGS